MKVLIAQRDGYARVVDLPEPACAPGHVLVRVSHSAVALPDEIAFLRTAGQRIGPDDDGVPLGSMCSGIVESVGDGVKHLKAGLRVAAFGRPYVYHAPRLAIPVENVVELPKKVNHEEGSYAGQGALAMNLVRSTRAGLGAGLLVFGAGMTGILAAQIARAAGANVLLIDGDEHRLAKARNVGVTNTSLVADDSLVEEVASLTAGAGADAAVLTREAPDGALGAASKLLRPGGFIAAASLGSRKPPAAFLEKELHLLAVATAGPPARPARNGNPAGVGRWTVLENMRVFLEMLADRRVQIAPLISERAPLERATVVFEKIDRAQKSIIGAVLTT